MSIYRCPVDGGYSSYESLKKRYVVAQGWSASDDVSFFLEEDNIAEYLPVFALKKDLDKVNTVFNLLTRDAKPGDIFVATIGGEICGICELPENFTYIYLPADEYANCLFPVKWIDWKDFCNEFCQISNPRSRGPFTRINNSNVAEFVNSEWDSYKKKNSIVLQPSECQADLEKYIQDRPEKISLSRNNFQRRLNMLHEVSKMDNAKIPYALNTIFYGPPGTGKTHILLNEIAEKYFYEKVGQLTEAERNANVVAGLNWWEVAALCLLDNGGSAKVPKIMEHPLLTAHLKNSNNKRPANAVWGQLQIHTKEDCEHVKYDLARRAEPKVFSKSQDSTWTIDRELLAANCPDLLERLNQYHTAAGVSEIKRYQFVTFHQSYSYENFVEGISAETDEDDNIHYKVKTGIFKDFCQTAQDNPDHKYALFIDEINRGNVSGVFGELISLIEADKRGKLHTTLPYSKTDFYVPENLYIFGSMNTADRSIDALDSALRRRFAFVEMPPKPELLSCDEFKPKYISVDLCALLKALNRRVEFLLDRDHKIGHSYFMTIQAETAAEELANLQASFKNQIIPLLEDYFYGNLEKVQMVLGRKFIVPDEEQELTSACLMCGEDAVEFQDKVSLKVADLSTLTEADFAELIK